MQNESQLKYMDIYKHFLGMIRSGVLRSNTRLPTESKIADQFKVSRITVIRALKQLQEEGYIARYEYTPDDKQGVIRVTLKYAGKKPVISGIKRISKPGLRVYAEVDKLPRVLNGLGIAIISTSSGLLTDKDARKKHVGGEVVAYVW